MITASEIMTKQSAVTVLVVLTTLVMAIVIGYVSWRLVRSKVQTHKIIKTPRRLFDNPALKIPSYKIPETRTGQEFAVSMWVYLADFQPTALGKPILMRGGSGNGGDRFQGTSPVVFLDAGSNKMYICARTNRQTSSGGFVEPTSLMDIVSIPKNSNPYVVMVVDYVPMQRWVHIVFSVQDYLLTVYMDGSIYAVENLIDGSYASTEASAGGGGRPMFAGCTGEFVIGSPGENAGADMRGFVSNTAFMNYAPLLDQVTSIYKTGPGSNSVLSMLGLDQYGVRSPVYKIGE